MLMDCGHNADSAVLIRGFGTKCRLCDSGRFPRLGEHDTNMARLGAGTPAEKGTGLEEAYRLLGRRLPHDFPAPLLRRLAWQIVCMFGKNRAGGNIPRPDLKEV